MSTPVPARGGWPGSRARARYARIAAGLLVVAGLIWFLQQRVDLDPVAIRTWLLGLGPIAPLAYVALYAVQVIVAPIPGLPIGVAAGYAFGLVPALVWGTLGLGIGVTVALAAGRLWGLSLLARVAGPDAIARWEQLRLVNSPLTWLIIFLGPSPDLILFVAGMSRIPLPRLFLIALIGRAPAMVAATLLGAGALDAGPWLFVGAAALGLVSCCGGLLFKRFAPPAAAGA